jgi:hypothetical protein
MYTCIKLRLYVTLSDRIAYKKRHLTDVLVLANHQNYKTCRHQSCNGGVSAYLGAILPAFLQETKHYTGLVRGVKWQQAIFPRPTAVLFFGAFWRRLRTVTNAITKHRVSRVFFLPCLATY